MVAHTSTQVAEVRGSLGRACLVYQQVAGQSGLL